MQGFAIPKDQQDKVAKFTFNGQPAELRHGSIVIAAITSCTNTSNPSVMLGAGLVAKKGTELGLEVCLFIWYEFMFEFQFLLPIVSVLLGCVHFCCQLVMHVINMLVMSISEANCLVAIEWNRWLPRLHVVWIVQLEGFIVLAYLKGRSLKYFKIILLRFLFLPEGKCWDRQKGRGLSRQMPYAWVVSLHCCTLVFVLQFIELSLLSSLEANCSRSLSWFCWVEQVKPWIKTSLAPGSGAVTQYLAKRYATHFRVISFWTVWPLVLANLSWTCWPHHNLSR